MSFDKQPKPDDGERLHRYHYLVDFNIGEMLDEDVLRIRALVQEFKAANPDTDDDEVGEFEARLIRQARIVAVFFDAKVNMPAVSALSSKSFRKAIRVTAAIVPECSNDEVVEALIAKGILTRIKPQPPPKAKVIPLKGQRR